MSELKNDLFAKQMINQIRALDQFGTWDKKSDEELLSEKYVRTKEELKSIPVIADIDEMKIKEIRLIFQAVALAFEMKTNVMATVIMEMSHEGLVFRSLALQRDRFGVSEETTHKPLFCAKLYL